MVFAVERVSQNYTYDMEDPGNFGESPCPEAKLIKTPQGVYPEYCDPCIWVVELDDIEDLLDFAVTHRRLIIEPSYWKFDGIATIRIYDGYIE